MGTVSVSPAILASIYSSSNSNGNIPYQGNYYVDLFSDTLTHFDGQTCILTGQSRKAAMQNINGTFTYYGNWNTYTASNLAIPLGGTYNVTNIAFQYDKECWSGASYNYLKVALAKIENGVITDIDYVFEDNENGQNKYNVDVSEDVSIEANYLILCTADGNEYVRNIVLTEDVSYTSNGGGATHIAKVTGQLKDLSSNLSDILMVSGGGGGGLINGSNVVNGADAGGISGSGNNSANQSTGYAFGLGEDGANLSGGGGGLYGGYKGSSSVSGGAGSGYIGNSLLSEKKMIGFNVPTSSTAETKTESVNVYSANSEANKPKAGNGHARIICLRPTQSSTFFEANFNTDGRDKINYKDINITETLYDYYYAEITKTMKQGQCISYFDPTTWDISNGSLNVSTIPNEGGALFFWGYDDSQIEQNVFPENCTVVLEAEVSFTTALDPEDEDDNRIVWFRAYTHDDDLDPYFARDIYSGIIEVNNHQVNAWYNVRLELTIENGELDLNETKGYINNVQTEDAWSLYGSEWVSIDTTAEKHFDCCGIGLHVDNPMKMRKFKISYRT